MQKRFIGICDVCGATTALPESVGQPMIDALEPADRADAPVIVRPCQLVRGSAAFPDPCPGNIMLEGQLALLARDLPYVFTTDKNVDQQPAGTT